MGETLGREAQPGTVVTGYERGPGTVTGYQGQPDTQDPSTGLSMPQPGVPTQFPTLRATTRPTFMSAFLQNLGPALAGGAGASTLGGGLGGALQGIEEQKRYTQEQGFKQQQMQRQGQMDAQESAYKQSQIQRNDVQNYTDLNPPAKPDTNVSELDLWRQQHPGEPLENFLKMKAGIQPPPKPDTSLSELDVWTKQNPGKPISQFWKDKAASAPAKTEKTPAQDAFERKVGENAATAIQGAQSADARLNIMNASYPSALKGDQQAMLALLTNHLGMTMGMQKGARITQAILKEAADSAPWLSSLKAKFDGRGYLTGVTLTPDQMRQMMDLAVESQNNAWQTVDQAAAQAGVTERVKRTNTTTPSGGVKIIRDANGRISGIE